MPLPTHLILRAAACLSAPFLIAGCSSSDARARDALAEYQSAAQLTTLLERVRRSSSWSRPRMMLPDYWVELGKLQSSTGNYSDAYYSFTRAYELDRSNPDVLRVVTELRIASGRYRACAKSCSATRNSFARRPLDQADERLGGLR